MGGEGKEEGENLSATADFYRFTILPCCAHTNHFNLFLPMLCEYMSIKG